jgi:Zn-dependent alcohol dehydrogenase
MKAAIINKVDSPLTVEDIIIPDTLKIGQVLVRMIVSGLCGAQLQEIMGEKNNSKFMPHPTGHEGCGEVVDIGPGVTRVKIGDKVILHWRKASGIEGESPSYLMGDKKISGGKVNTLMEYSIVSENRITAVPHDIEDDFCALMGCGISTSFSVVSNDANVKFGESVIVVGCGGVGLGCINASNLLHASLVIGIDINDDKNKIVEKNGGRYFNLNDCLDYLRKENIKIDCIIDTVGNLNIISEIIPFLSDSGRCVLVALTKASTSLNISDPNSFFGSNGKKIITTQAGGFDPDRDIPRFIKFYRSGKIRYKDIITHKFDLDEINEAIYTLRSGKSGRILINLKK